MRYRVGFILVVVTLMFGCSSIPENGAALNSQVSVGISRMHSQTEAIITALAEIERGILDENWEEIYRRSEEKYRRDERIAENIPLTQEQAIDIATIAAAVRENVLNDISSKEAELKDASRRNADTVIELNETVTNYLLSLQSLEEAKSNATELLTEITGVDVSGLVNLSRRAIDRIR